MATRADDRFLQRTQVGYARADDRAAASHAHIAAAPRARRPLPAAENTMVETCTNALTEAGTGTLACPEAEHFSGYIITTAPTAS